MKHVVELKYTNPSHEHVSLRRRVETVNRVVEAQSADEALNRAANQQRSLGFRIQSANIVEQVLAEEVEQVDEMDKSQPSSSRGAEGLATGNKATPVTAKKTAADALKILKKKVKPVKEEVEQVDEANMRFDPEAAARPKSSDVKNFQMRDKNPRAAAASKKYIRRMTKLGGLGPNQTKKDTEAHMKAHFGEEVEQVEEGKIAKALAVGAMSLASMGAKAHTDTTKSVAQLAQERPALAQRLKDIGATGQVPASDKRAAELQRKQDQEMPASERRAKELKKEEVGADKRDAGYKMSPAVRKAQGESDRLSKVVKPVQAGTLAAQRRRAEMKKEEVETVDEGIMSGLKKAQVKWRTAHRAVYGTDPSAKSMVVGAVARLAGAKMHTARAVGAALGGKPVSKQQQAAAIKRAGKPAMARMRNEEKDIADKNDVNSNVKGKRAAHKMTKKAAEIRKAKIEGSVNKINMEPTMDLNKKAEK